MVDRLAAAFRKVHIVAIAAKHDSEHLPHRRLVVDDENADFAVAGRSLHLRRSDVRVRRGRTHTAAALAVTTEASSLVADLGKRIGRRTRTVVPVPTVDDTWIEPL